MSFSEGTNLKRKNGTAALVEVKAQLCSMRQENADIQNETHTEAKWGRDKRERLSQGGRRHGRDADIQQSEV